VRGPGVPAGHTIEAMVLNSDFAPTFAAIAGIEPPEFVDGRSFLPLFADPAQPWRESFLIERRQLENQYVELAERLGMPAHELELSAQFDAIRTPDWTYVEYGTGERELYDLARDPDQLDNVVETADPALVTALAARLAELRTCAGAECRRLEDLPPLESLSSKLAAQPQ
jgi:N-acetylglucosamine-6-sulfatase